MQENTVDEVTTQVDDVASTLASVSLDAAPGLAVGAPTDEEHVMLGWSPSIGPTANWTLDPCPDRGRSAFLSG